jgi:hypothetical protein
MVSLPGNDRRALGRIEKALLSDDLHLSSLYAIFTRLAGNDAMPGTEQVGSRPRWLRPPVLISAAGLIVIVAALILSVTVRTGQPCYFPAHGVPEYSNSLIRNTTGCAPVQAAEQQTARRHR